MNSANSFREIEVNVSRDNIESHLATCGLFYATGLVKDNEEIEAISFSPTTLKGTDGIIPISLKIRNKNKEVTATKHG